MKWLPIQMWMLAVILCAAVAAPGFADDIREITLIEGESIDLARVFWINYKTCQSSFIRVEGIDVLESPPGLSLSIRDEQVDTAPYANCGKKPGGTIVATARGIQEKESGPLVFRVRYQTQSGLEQSTHRFVINLYPKKL